MLELDTRDDHNHNASNHGHGSAATYWCADNDNNDARRQRRLLIAKAGRGTSVAGTALWAVSAFKKAVLNSTGHRPVAPVVTRSGFLSGRFYALGFLFLYLTDYRRDRLEFFAIA